MTTTQETRDALAAVLGVEPHRIGFDEAGTHYSPNRLPNTGTITLDLAQARTLLLLLSAS